MRTAATPQKLSLGLQRLAEAGNDPEMLGLALISLHGALEDGARTVLAANKRVPAAMREDVRDVQRTSWKQLLDLLETYQGLSAADIRTIAAMNRLRQEVAHGGQFRGTRQDVESYAKLVKSLLRAPKASARPAPKRTPQPAARPSAPPVPQPQPQQRQRSAPRRPSGWLPWLPTLPSGTYASWPFLIHWIVWSLLGLVGGTLLGGILGPLGARMLQDDAGRTAVVGGLIGLGMGTGQAYVLRQADLQRRLYAGSWALGPALGGLSLVGLAIMPWQVMLPLSALIVGLLQWRTLRWRFPAHQLWILVGALAWAAFWWLRWNVAAPGGPLLAVLISILLSGLALQGLSLAKRRKP